MYHIIGADGKDYGPVSAEQLRQWRREGRVNAQTLARRTDAADWTPVAQFPELAPPLPGRPPVASPPARVTNYLAPAVLVTLCCCLPLGIPAIVFAAQASSKLAAGDIAGAQAASRRAGWWCLISFLTGGGFALVWFLISLIGSLAGHGRFP